MKTITREYYVTNKAIEAIKNQTTIEKLNYCYEAERDYPNKITISFEVPEKQVTISESEFDEYVKDFFKPSINNISPMNSGVKMQNHLKQKIFGDKD